MADDTKDGPVLSPLPQDAISLAQLVNFQALSHPNLPALIIHDQTINYGDLLVQVQQLAALLQKNNIQRLGILAAKSLLTYLSVLAAHWVGIAYVPLNVKFPEHRLKKIIASAKVDGLVVDREQTSLVDNTLKKITLEDILKTPTQVNPVLEVKTTDLAYLIFTSGSSGEPKGVPVSFGNLGRFIKTVSTRYPLTTVDRVSQFSALSFDVSIFDMCLAFSAGAALYVVPDYTQMAPAKFIDENKLSVWLSVPSVINNMARLKLLRPNGFATLKYSLFTGEALTLAQARAWQIAAPASQLENLYGPTEATIDCLGQIYDEHDKAYRDQVSIGKPFPEMFAALIDDKENFLPLGKKGELVIAGPQVAAGYWQDEDLSKLKFKYLSHPEFGRQRWFLTGDYCYQDNDSVFYYLKRLDNQVKILGNRIELDEIEFHMRDLTGCHDVAACLITVGANQEIAIVMNSKPDRARLLSQLKERLPDYMLPERIIYRDVLPYNTNGKIDRQALAAWVMATIEENGRGETAC